MSMGYIPNILTALAAAAAAKCDLALIIVCMNDCTMSAKLLVDDDIATDDAVVVEDLVVEESFAAAPPRGNIIIVEVIVEVVAKRFIGRFGGHIVVAHADKVNRNRIESRHIRASLWR